MAPRDYQRDFYTSCSGVQDQQSRLAAANKIRFVLEELLELDLTSSICLDLGSASGSVTSALAGLFKMTVGLEYDPVALADVKVIEPSLNAYFVRGDALKLPVSDQSCDFILCLQVIEHVADDTILMDEIYRVLQPGGKIYFSGPNKLFPIEPHYHLLFLHWLPKRASDAYLRTTGRGEVYYEHSRTYWGLRTLTSRFELLDMTGEVLRYKMSLATPDFMDRAIKRVPDWIMASLSPFLPNFNWILTKPTSKN